MYLCNLSKEIKNNISIFNHTHTHVQVTVGYVEVHRPVDLVEQL